MIRRETNNNGERRWLLIAQPEHARLSGVLAESWGAAPFPPLVPRDELLAAIYHHDDGWAAWEEFPKVDPQTGRPLEFTEMPLADALAIWRGSIAVAGRLGDLAAWVVAGHFSSLLRSSSTWRKAGGEQARLASDFLQEQDAARLTWLASWLAADANHSPTLAEQGLRSLQFFDALSLWFCCAERSRPQRFDTPAGPSVMLRPIDAARFVVEPWPFTQLELRLAIRGRSVLAVGYRTPDELARAESRMVDLHWVLHSRPHAPP